MQLFIFLSIITHQYSDDVFLPPTVTLRRLAWWLLRDLPQGFNNSPWRLRGKTIRAGGDSCEKRQYTSKNLKISNLIKVYETWDFLFTNLINV